MNNHLIQVALIIFLTKTSLAQDVNSDEETLIKQSIQKVENKIRFLEIQPLKHKTSEQEFHILINNCFKNEKEIFSDQERNYLWAYYNSYVGWGNPKRPSSISPLVKTTNNKKQKKKKKIRDETNNKYAHFCQDVFPNFTLFPSLPSEDQNAILRFLPKQEFKNYRLVCREWHKRFQPRYNSLSFQPQKDRYEEDFTIFKNIIFSNKNSFIEIRLFKIPYQYLLDLTSFMSWSPFLTSLKRLWVSSSVHIKENFFIILFGSRTISLEYLSLFNSLPYEEDQEKVVRSIIKYCHKNSSFKHLEFSSVEKKEEMNKFFGEIMKPGVTFRRSSRKNMNSISIYFED